MKMSVSVSVVEIDLRLSHEHLVVTSFMSKFYETVLIGKFGHTQDRLLIFPDSDIKKHWLFYA